MPLRGFHDDDNPGGGSDPARLVRRVWGLLESDPRLDVRAHPLELAVDDGTLTLTGEVAEVAAKKRALELVRMLPEVRHVVDRLVVRPAGKMGDGEMRDHLRNALLGEPALLECRLVLRAEGVEDRALDPEGRRGSVTATVQGGVVTLEGEVPSLSHARLAGVLAWWVPGTRDVKNELRAAPPEADNDDEINDAVRIVLEKEPLVDAGQLGIRTAGGHVTLSGTLRSEGQRQIAERDAWYVAGVTDVTNRVQVQLT